MPVQSSPNATAPNENGSQAMKMMLSHNTCVQGQKIGKTGSLISMNILKPAL